MIWASFAGTSGAIFSVCERICGDPSWLCASWSNGLSERKELLREPFVGRGVASSRRIICDGLGVRICSPPAKPAPLPPDMYDARLDSIPMCGGASMLFLSTDSREGPERDPNRSFLPPSRSMFSIRGEGRLPFVMSLSLSSPRIGLFPLSVPDMAIKPISSPTIETVDRRLLEADPYGCWFETASMLMTHPPRNPRASADATASAA